MYVSNTCRRTRCWLTASFQLQQKPASPHLPVEKLFGRLSSRQELFAVEHSMFVVQMAADVPVH